MGKVMKASLINAVLMAAAGAQGSATGTGNAAAKAAPVIKTVTMTDGRVVEFAGKRKLLKESTITTDGQVRVQLDLVSGQTRLFTIPSNMLLKFAAHGAEQKLGDEIAGLDDVGDCEIALDELIDRLYQGEWGQKREAGGLAGTSILARALVEKTGKPMDAIKAFLAKKTQAEKLALRATGPIKVIIDRLEAEKASTGPKVDTDALLGELESGNVTDSVAAAKAAADASKPTAGAALAQAAGVTGAAPAKAAPKGTADVKKAA